MNKLLKIMAKKTLDLARKQNRVGETLNTMAEASDMGDGYITLLLKEELITPMEVMEMMKYRKENK